VGREREGYLLFYCLSVSFSETLFVIAGNTLSEKLHTFALQMWFPFLLSLQIGLSESLCYKQEDLDHVIPQGWEI